MKLEFETERLYLRKFQQIDAPALLELNDDEEVMRYTGDVPFQNVNHALEFVANYHKKDAQYETYDMGRLAVIRKEDHAFIGWTGLKYHLEDDFVDIGYRFMKKFWGKGYATESCRRIVQHAFEDHHLDYFVAHVHESNIGSQKVAQRLGMTIDHRFLWEDRKPARCYKLTSDGYKN